MRGGKEERGGVREKKGRKKRMEEMRERRDGERDKGMDGEGRGGRMRCL